MAQDNKDIQSPSAEKVYEEELIFLSSLPGDRPAGWALSPEHIVTFICGSGGEKLKRPNKSEVDAPRTLAISEKFVGNKALVERCVITLLGQRGLMLVGEPGTAKSMLSELLSAAISGSSEMTVQGTAGTDESHLRYGWNYSALIAKGPHAEALIPSPILLAMRGGKIGRVEEITRCLPEIQDALVSILSERRLSIPELNTTEYAKAGFNLIGTANLRDKGVSEMSAALKRRFNFEHVHPISDFDQEVALVKSQTQTVLPKDLAKNVDEAVLETLVTLFRDLRNGVTNEGWAVEKPEAVMSTAEVVQVVSAVVQNHQHFPKKSAMDHVPGYLKGVVIKDDVSDLDRLLAYWDSTVKRRAESEPLWAALYEARNELSK